MMRALKWALVVAGIWLMLPFLNGVAWWTFNVPCMFCGIGHGRDLDGRYAASPLKPWFDSLKSGKGPCCSDADGSAISDADWESRDGRYRVRLEDQWWDVPDDAVITEPNRAGRTMVWPVYQRALDGLLKINIRCFIPGSMT